MKFNWDEFKNGKVAVNCDTEEKAKEFVKECFERGMKWVNFTESKTMFDWYKKYTCYDYKIDENRLMYADKKFYKNNGYKIIKWESEKMKLRCVDNEGIESWLTPGNEYEVMEESYTSYEVIGDDGVVCECCKSRFELVEEPTEFTFQEVIARNIPGVYENCNDDGARVKSVEINEHGSFTINADFSGLIELDLGLGINENLKLKLQEPKKKVTIYKVEHKKDGKKYDFISNETRLLQCYEFVICDTSQGKSYGRIVDLEVRELTNSETKQYKECWRA